MNEEAEHVNTGGYDAADLRWDRDQPDVTEMQHSGAPDWVPPALTTDHDHSGKTPIGPSIDDDALLEGASPTTSPGRRSPDEEPSRPSIKDTASSEPPLAIEARRTPPRSPRIVRGLLRPSHSPPPRSPSMSALDSSVNLGGSGSVSGKGVLRARTPPGGRSGVAGGHFPELGVRVRFDALSHNSKSDRLLHPHEPPGLALESPSEASGSQDSSLDQEHDGDSITKLPKSFRGGVAARASGIGQQPSRRSSGSSQFGGSTEGSAAYEADSDEEPMEESDDDDLEDEVEQDETAGDFARKHLDRFFAMWRSRVVAEVAAAITKRVRVTALAVQYALGNEAKLPESLLRTGPDSAHALSDSDSDEEDEAVMVSSSGGLGVARDASQGAGAPPPQGDAVATDRAASPAPWQESASGSTSWISRVAITHSASR